jgi:phosphoglycerate dehydrogenase-like enzyme
MSPRIIVVLRSPDLAEIVRQIAPAAFELVVVQPDSSEFMAALASAHYLVCYPELPMHDDFYQAAPHLKLVQLLSAGYDNIDLKAAQRAKVRIANNGGANAIAVAEHAIMLMLAVSRRLVWQHQNICAGRWRCDHLPARFYELFDKRLGIIGLGTIGTKVARLAQAFGMRVEYYDINRRTEEADDALRVRFRLVDELLKYSDILSLHVPLNGATRGLIGRSELALMKPTAILVNTCRGPVVDEAALCEALTSGTLLGAGLDVFEREPPPADHPLFKLENVVLTAHFAGPTWDNHLARFRNGFDNVQRVERGERPLWVIPELDETPAT